jgi:hypothetical protein
MVGVAVMAVLGIAAACGAIVEARRRRNADPAPPPPPPSRTSALAALSFLCGLAAIVTVMTSGVVAACASMDEVTGIPAEARPHFDLGSRLVLYGGLVPAVLAVAFALAARGSISEARGALRGRPLYRTGLLLALLSGALAMDAKVLNPANWLPAGAPGGAGGAGGVIGVKESAGPRGFLGVIHEPRSAGGSQVLRVLPDTPAERAGLQAGDLIVEIDGTPISSGELLADRLRNLDPGTDVSLLVRRGSGSLRLSAVLSAPFSSLIETLRAQATDSSRLSVLRAAGQDRRYSSAELRKICETFSMDINRLTAIRQALPHLSDPENAYQILNALVSISSKEEASRMIVELPKPPPPPPK